MSHESSAHRTRKKVPTVEIDVILLGGSADADVPGPVLVVGLVVETLTLTALESVCRIVHRRSNLCALVERVTTCVPLEVLQVMAVFAAHDLSSRTSGAPS